MACKSSHAHCIFCGKCLTCQPHKAHTDRNGNPR
jgi:hypothetical protein